MELTPKAFTLRDFKSDEEANSVDLYFDEILEVVNSKLSIDVTFPTLTPGTVDIEFPIEHSRGYIPTKFLLVSSNKAGQLYKSEREWTETAAYLKFSAASANIEVLIW